MTKYLYITRRNDDGRQLTRNTRQFSNMWSDSKKRNIIYDILNANSIEFDPEDIEFTYDIYDTLSIYHLPLEAPLTFGPGSSNNNRQPVMQYNLGGSSSAANGRFDFGLDSGYRRKSSRKSASRRKSSRKSPSKRKSSRKSASRRKSSRKSASRRKSSRKSASRRKSVKVSRRKSSRKSPSKRKSVKVSRRKSSRKSPSKRKSVKVSRRKSSRKSASKRKSSKKSSRRKSSKKMCF